MIFTSFFVVGFAAVFAIGDMGESISGWLNAPSIPPTTVTGTTSSVTGGCANITAITDPYGDITTNPINYTTGDTVAAASAQMDAWNRAFTMAQQFCESQAAAGSPATAPTVPPNCPSSCTGAHPITWIFDKASPKIVVKCTTTTANNNNAVTCTIHGPCKGIRKCS